MIKNNKMFWIIIYLIGVILAFFMVTIFFLNEEDIILGDTPYILFYSICSWSSIVFMLILCMIYDRKKVIYKKKK